MTINYKKLLLTAATAAAALSALGSDVGPRHQINVETRLVSMMDENLRDKGLEFGWGVGVEAVFFGQGPGQPALTFGAQYDQLECDGHVVKLKTYGFQVGAIGQFDHSREPERAQLLWRSSVGYFWSITEGPGKKDETGIGFEIGLQYGPLRATKKPSVAILYSIRPDAFGERNVRLIGLLSFPVSFGGE
ncbi:MAG: hypothetical protein M5U21_11410 [Fimbriimonadaceae bacterium]|nr:hypothetical protein [Fimbriimonadaceae bacterium]